MNKYLLMSAAAVIAAAAGGTVANASTTVHFQTREKEGSYCDYLIISGPDSPSSGALFAAQHIGGAECGTSVFNDAGSYDKKAKVPKTKMLKAGTVQFADTTWNVAEVGTDLQYDAINFDLSYPFESGGKWAIVVSEEGTTAEVLNYGYQNTDPGVHKLGKTTVSDAIQAMKLNGK